MAGRAVYRNLEERLMANSFVCRETGCWVWLGAVQANGYGRINVRKGEQRLAHRVAYETLKGALDDGMEVHHLCHCRRCINPNHLEQVEHRENCAPGNRDATHYARKQRDGAGRFIPTDSHT